MTYFDRNAWGADPNIRGTSGWPSGKPNSLTVHGVGANVGQRSPADYFATLRGIQRHAVSKGLSDFDYNFAVDWAGNVYEGRGWGVQSGAHHVGNDESLAVLVLDSGDGDVPFTDACKGAIRWLRDTGCRGGPIWPHRFWNQFTTKYVTSCPGNEISDWCAAGAPGPNASPEEDDLNEDDKKFIGEQLGLRLAALEINLGGRIDAVDKKVNRIKGSLIGKDGVGLVGRILRAVTK